jgi:hypothetical protein
MSQKRERPRDLAWEALVEVTHANEAIERGKLNVALKAIRVAWESEGGHPDDLHKEIPLRANAYRTLWPRITLTPTALAVHWKRVAAENAMRKGTKGIIDEMRRENRHGEDSNTV